MSYTDEDRALLESYGWDTCGPGNNSMSRARHYWIKDYEFWLYQPNDPDREGEKNPHQWHMQRGGSHQLHRWFDTAAQAAAWAALQGEK